MENQRPEGRKRRITGTGGGLERRGEGLNTGPVGRGGGIGQGKNNATSQFRESGRGGNYNGMRGGGLGIIAVVLLLLLFGGRSGL